jgi:uncharacterized repeat protein (TIGR01451 family)
VNAEAGEVINISLCGYTTTQLIDVEIFGPGGTGANSPSLSTTPPIITTTGRTELNYNNAAVFTSLAGGSVIGGLTGTATAGSNNSAIRITSGNARTATQATLCPTSGPGTNATYPSGVLTNPIKLVVPSGGAGTYEIRLNLLTSAATDLTGDNASLPYWDVSVTSSTATNPDPKLTTSTATQFTGRVWAPAWAFNAGNSFTQAAGAYNGSFFIRTPGGRPNTEFLWNLSLSNFAPQRHDIIANGIGLNPPYSRYSITNTPAPSPTPTATRNFPIYLSAPTGVSFSGLLPEPAVPNLSSFRFIDSAGQDNTITPNPTTTAVQDKGNFEFVTDVDGTYELTIDTNQDGIFGAGDKVLFGTTAAPNTTTAVEWNGTDANNVNLPVGTYPVQLLVRIGEYHFVTFDAETSGGTQSGSVGGGNGLTIFKGNGGNTQVYWDDATFLGTSGGLSNLPNGGLSGTADGRHTWGNFSTNPPATGTVGNSDFIDTWVYGASQRLETPAIIADLDENDFGDAPDTYGTDKDATVGGNGASHVLSTTIRLGTATTDADTDGQPNAAANGDDANNTDDEDGVTSFPALSTSNTTYTVPVRVQNTSGANAYLAGWIDFNRDGVFSASEGVTQTIATGTNANVNLTWTGLSSLGLSEGDTYARFRINNDPMTTSNFNGGLRNGEVEDYSLTITGATTTYDYGDAPDAGTGTGIGNYNTTSADGGAAHIPNSNLKLGTNAPDADTGSLQDINASQDDTTGTDDEDGVTLPPTLTTASTTYSATVNVTNTIGTAATLVGWIDFNQNGVFETTEAQTATIADNTSNGSVVLTWTGLSGLTQGNTYARFRISNDALTSSTPTGTIGRGEVEDYILTINPVDYGDAPDTTAGTGIGDYQTTLANNGPSHTILANLRMGASVDADNGTLQNTNADLDDTTNTGSTDDEDGVTLPSLTTATTSYSATVNVTTPAGTPGYLVGWIDFNRNGQFETSEGVLYDADTGTPGIQPIAANTSAADVILTWTGITGLNNGDVLYARFRLTSSVLSDANGTQSIGALGNGEVEDYPLTVTTPSATNPNVILVKRITAVNTTTFTTFVNDPGATNDNDPDWPGYNSGDGSNTFTVGQPSTTANPGDELEFTIYFLNTGDAPAANLRICDVLNPNVTFVSDTYNGQTPTDGGLPSDLGIQLTIGSSNLYLTGINDSPERGEFVAAGTAPSNCINPATSSQITTAENVNGAIVVNVTNSSFTQVPYATSSGSPSNAYGFIRFHATVK